MTPASKHQEQKAHRPTEKKKSAYPITAYTIAESKKRRSASIGVTEKKKKKFGGAAPTPTPKLQGQRAHRPKERKQPAYPAEAETIVESGKKQ